MKPLCERPACHREAVLHGICRVHYDRERGRHRHRPERLLANRARTRALSQLAHMHKADFKALYGQALEQVHEEAARHREALAGAEGSPDGMVRLRPGPRASDEDTEDRINVVQTVRCGSCQSFHEKGHKCPTCATARTPAHDRDGQIRQLIEAGRPATWIVDQGYSRADVTAVLRQLNSQPEVV